MKQILILASLVYSMTVVAQVTSVTDSPAHPAITEAGKPLGKLTEMKISKEGGNLISADGKLELKIPAGALSKKTTISIQPIISTAPNGNGQAYRLEPSGIKFQKPVQIVFHYDEDESKEGMQLLMGICMQDHTGQWYGLQKHELDTMAKTISGNISHFSDWSKFDVIKLYPAAARLKVKKELQLTIDLVSNEADDEITALIQDDLAPLKKRKIPWTSVWKANEIHNGNSNVGTITVHGKSSATYKAPSTVPAKNPVAVTADLKGLNYKYKSAVFTDLTLVSNILIYDNAYEVKMISSTNGIAGSELGNVNYKDTGSFVVSLNGKDSRIIEKVNKNTSAELDYHGNCTITLLKSGAGNIHVIGASGIRVTPGQSADKPALVEIVFIRAPTIMTVLQFACPKTPIWNNGAANGLLAMSPAYPQFIKFLAKEEEQTLYEIGKEGGDLYLKITVKQLTED